MLWHNANVFFYTLSKVNSLSLRVKMRELETLNITETCFHVGILWYMENGGSIMCKARLWSMGTDESGFLCVWMGSRPWQGGKSTKCLLIRMTKDWISWLWIEVYKRAVCLCVSCLCIMSFALFTVTLILYLGVWRC